nr:unnamed protein product [Callosobruchus analis]
MTLAQCRIELTALVTEADMGQIELLLGQATPNAPGVTMVVRDGRLYLTTKPNIEEYMAALGEAYVPGAEIVNRTDNCPKRMLTRPVDDALSQVVGSEALGPAGTVISTQAGETDQPMAGEIYNRTMAGASVADLVIAGGSNTATAGRGVIVDTAKASSGAINAATAGGQKRVNLSNDSIGTNREVRGDDLA